MIERPQSQWVKRDDRKRASLTGVAYHSDGSWTRVHMTNLSYDGCHLLTDKPLDIGETLLLVMPQMRHQRVQVRWSRDQESGVRFLAEAGMSVQDDRRSRLGI
jgi:hypothetical protein